MVVGIYALLGVAVCGGAVLWLIAKGKKHGDLFLLVWGFPEVLVLLVIWPFYVPMVLFMALKEEANVSGPSVIPTQVSRKMIGQRGVVMRELSPVGEVRIGGVDYEAVAEFGVVGEGEEVVVRSQDSLRLKVGRGES